MISAKSAGAVAVAVGVLCLAPTAIATDCGSRKEKAVGAYFKALVKCNKAEGHGVELDSNCHSGAKARLAKAFVNAEGAAGCAELGDVAEVSEDIELMYASIVSHIPKYRETCSGGVDDDGDGDVDCADDDCFNVEPCNYCGNGLVESPGEDCDAGNVGGASCAMIEAGALYGGGTLRCDPRTCKFDVADVSRLNLTGM